MEIKEVRSAELKQDEGGYLFLALDLDGRKARVFSQQALFNHGLVFLDTPFDGEGSFQDFTVILPADPENGRPKAQEYTAFTNDLIVYRLARMLRETLRSGGWRLGPVAVPKLADVVTELN